MTTRRHPSSSLQKFFASPSMAFLLILPFSFLLKKSNAQIVPTCESFLPYSYDSGAIPNPIPPLQQQQVVVLIDSITVSHTFSPWIQLDFSQTTLAPNVQLQLDGSNAQTQILDAKSLYASNGYSAVFDGESVSVKLVYDSSTPSSLPVSSTIVPPLKKDLSWNAFRGSNNITSPKKPPKKPSSSPSPSSSSVSRVVISNIKVGLCGDDDEDNDDVLISTICGSTDDRIRSYDVRQGRMGDCTAWLIGKNIFLRAGHCATPNESTRLHFTSEASSAPVSDQYAVDLPTYKFLSDGIGKDWAIGRLHPNSATGLLAGVAQSAKCNPSGTGDATCGWYKLGNAPSKTSGNTVRITGYGVHPDGRMQRTHVGALTKISSTSLQYSADSEVRLCVLCRKIDLCHRFRTCIAMLTPIPLFYRSSILLSHARHDVIMMYRTHMNKITGRKLWLSRPAPRDRSCHWHPH